MPLRDTPSWDSTYTVARCPPVPLEAVLLQTVAGGGSLSGRLGLSVAIDADGDTALAGAVRHSPINLWEGGVGVYTRNASDVWSLQQVLVSSDHASTNYFGNAVALSADGDTAAIAFFSSVGAALAHNVEIWDRAGTVWTLTAQLIVPGDDSTDGTGISLALSHDGSVVAVGSYLDNDTFADQGSITYWRKTAGVWGAGTKLYPTAPTASYNFGKGLSLDEAGDILVVGEPGAAASPNLAVGRAHYYTWDGSSYDLDATVTSGVDHNDQFGNAVDCTPIGDIVLFGSEYWDSGSINGKGKAFLYDEQAEVRDMQGTPGGALDVYFGRSVSVSDDGAVVVIGAPVYHQADSYPGTVYVFRIRPGQAELVAEVDPPTPTANANFGNSVAVSGDGQYFVVGEPLIAAEAGAVHFYKIQAA